MHLQSVDGYLWESYISRGDLGGPVWLLRVSNSGLRALVVGMRHLYLFQTETGRRVWIFGKK